MKYLAKICIAGLAALSLAACSHIAKFTSEDFVAFSNASYSVQESAGSIKIPVYAYPQDGNPNTTVSFKVIEQTAKTGEDFSIEPAGGVLTFSGDSVQYITVKVVDHDGVYTGNKTFGLEMTSVSNDYTFPNFNSCKITILDEDHPLLDLFGEYTFTTIMADFDDEGNIDGIYRHSWTMNMGPVEGDVTKVSMDHITFFSVNYASYCGPMPVVASVSGDKKTITISCPQTTKGTAAPWGLDENFILYKHGGWKGEYITENDTVTFKQQEDGTWSTTESFGFSTPTDVKDYPFMFTHYSVSFGDFGAAYPTTFKKN